METELDVDQIFFKNLDPFYHLKHASFIRYAKDFEDEFHLDDQPITDFKLGKEIFDNCNETRLSAVHFIRFHAIDTLMTVLCGSKPHGPIIRFASLVRNSDFNKIVDDIGNRKIPDSQAIDGIVDFNQWMSTKFLGRRVLDPQNFLPEEIVDFVSLQAKFAGKRQAYNAFKHGCRIGISHPSIKRENQETGRCDSVFELDNSVGWSKWKENRKTGESTLELGAVEINLEEDVGSLFVMGLLVRAIRDAHLTAEGQIINVDLPKNIELKKFLSSDFVVKFDLKKTETI